jgi:hypothetical protein
MILSIEDTDRAGDIKILGFRGFVKGIPERASLTS